MIKLIVMVLVGAFIGWMTNVFAIKLLFRPITPVKILFLPIKIQGLMPKRQNDIAHSIGQTVEKELLSSDDILKQLLDKADKDMIMEKIGTHVREAIKHKMPVLLPAMFKNMALQYVDQMIEEEGPNIISALQKEVSNHVEHELDIAGIVEEKINAFPFEVLEGIILSLAKQELRHIEALGGILGGLIGLIQGILIQII